MTLRPLCFVIMPFGKKRDPAGGPDIDFDKIYKTAIEPGILGAGLEPLRADEERTGGIIHKPMYERLLLCNYAVADMTTANANVFYEIGVRHAVRPGTTLPIFAKHQPIPFDVNFLRALPYDLGEGKKFPEDTAEKLRTGLTERLRQLIEEDHESNAVDSPIFQLIEEYKPGEIDRLRTDSFRVTIDRIKKDKAAITAVRAMDLSGQEKRDKLKEIEAGYGDMTKTEVSLLVDLYLSYRANKNYVEMIDLYDRMPKALQMTRMVREQLGFALNRNGNRDKALSVLEQVIEDFGPSSETFALIGRIYKDNWQQEKETEERRAARGFLKKAINAYLQGFEADWRDAYPGINALTLLDIKGDDESLAKRDELLPVVRFSVKQRLRGENPDYWDHATLLELAVLANDENKADEHLDDALANVREVWEPETTARNLMMIRDARRERDQVESWLDELITDLKK